MRKWILALKKKLAPYSKVAGAGYGAFVAIRQAQHPSGNVPSWLLWTGAVLMTILFLIYLVEQIPALSLTVYRAFRRDVTTTSAD